MCVETIYKLSCLDFNLFSFWGGTATFKKNFFNVYLFLRERERGCVCGGRAEKETQNLKQASGSALSVQSLIQGSNLQTTRS